MWCFRTRHAPSITRFQAPRRRLLKAPSQRGFQRLGAWKQFRTEPSLAFHRFPGLEPGPRTSGAQSQDLLHPHLLLLPRPRARPGASKERSPTSRARHPHTPPPSHSAARAPGAGAGDAARVRAPTHYSLLPAHALTLTAHSLTPPSSPGFDVLCSSGGIHGRAFAPPQRPSPNSAHIPPWMARSSRAMTRRGRHTETSKHPNR